MVTHGMKLLGALAGILLVFCRLMVAGAMDPSPSAADHWEPTGRTAQSITGRVTLAPGQITFQNGKSLSLAPPSQMRFRPDKKQKVTADLLRVTQPDDPVIENGNRLCGGKNIALPAGLEVSADWQGNRPTVHQCLLRPEARPADHRTIAGVIHMTLERTDSGLARQQGSSTCCRHITGNQ